MTGYAVHHDWIEDYATQAPVGIWNERAESYYPPRTAHLKHRGHRASSRLETRTWEEHLAYLTDTSSAYNANWSVVSSERSMQETMEALWQGFLASNPPTEPLPFTVEEPADSPGEVTPEPAERFLLAQAWWVASEFARRHPNWAIRFGDQGSYLTLVNPESEMPRIVVNPSAIHLFGQDATHTTIAHPLSTADPYEAVTAIESFIGDPPQLKTPASTPRTLAYRLLATVLNVAVNEKARWEVCNEIVGDDGNGPIRAGLVPQFSDAAHDASILRSEALDLGEPLRHYWAILRDAHPVAIVSTEGRAYLPDRTIDLQPAYETNRHSMLRLVTDLIGDLLT
jgi:hypothetical protein